LTGPAWGRLAAGGNPKVYYVRVQFFQGAGFLALAATRTVFELFVARFALGFMGAASTLAFLIPGRARARSGVRQHGRATQAAMTVGQVTGPLGGAIAAARLGFRPSFVLGGLILVGSAAFVHWGVRLPPESERPAPVSARIRAGDLVVESLILLAVSTQLF